MKKKGFTLIELLAVIVILAIIALIATPIILNIISDTKEESNKRSVELYGKAVENAVAKYQLNNNESISGTFTTTDGKTLTKGEKELKVEYNGNVVCTTTEIYEDGTVYLADCTVNGGDKKYTYGKLILKPGAYDANDKLIADWDTLVSYGLDVEHGHSNSNVFEKEELKNVKKLVIPDSVKFIGTEAFYGCRNLTSVTIGNGVTSIETAAFYGTGLTSVTIPDSVTSIGNFAFAYSGLTSVTIPDSVTYIGDHAFEYTGLTSVTIPGAYIGRDAFAGTGLTSVTIQSGDIVESAFENCSNLTSVTIGNSVTGIGSSAFSGCSNLTSVTIPDRVTSIGDGAFAGTGLTSVTIPDSVTSIEDYAFSGCSNLTSVTIGNGVTSIGESAFAYSGLTSATFNNPEGWSVDHFVCDGPDGSCYSTTTSLDLLDPATNATYLKNTYSEGSWKRK